MDVYKGKRVLLDDGSLGPACVFVEKGKVVAISRGDEIPVDRQKDVSSVIDAGDDILMPGLVDSNVHICDPGHEDYETFLTITKAAAAGGVTTIVDNPVLSKPVTTTVGNLLAKTGSNRGKCFVDVGYWGGAVPKTIPNVRSLLKSGVCGLKCYLYDTGVRSFPKVDFGHFGDILREMRTYQSVLLVDAILPGNGDGNGDQESPGSYESFLASHPEDFEVEAIAKVLAMCRENEGEVRIHFSNLASGKSVDLIRMAQKEGLPVTAETCVHYLSFTSDQVPQGGTQFKCVPPLRNKDNLEKLWQGVLDGVISQVVTNHLPSTKELKCLHPDAGNDFGCFFKAASGISSLQFGLPQMWTLAKQRDLSLPKINNMMSLKPAIVAGLDHRKGVISVGFDADFVIFDPDKEFVVKEEDVLFKNKTCPYIGRMMFGEVKRTVVRGITVFRDGMILLEKPPGRNLLHGELGDEVGRFGQVIPGGPMITRRLSMSPPMVEKALDPGESHFFSRRNSYFS